MEATTETNDAAASNTAPPAPAPAPIVNLRQELWVTVYENTPLRSNACHDLIDALLKKFDVTMKAA